MYIHRSTQVNVHLDESSQSVHYRSDQEVEHCQQPEVLRLPPPSHSHRGDHCPGL